MIDGKLLAYYGAKADGIHDDTGAFRAAADVARLRGALAALVGWIDTSAKDDGPLVTQGSMVAQVCKVLRKTDQYERAKALLGEPPGEQATRLAASLKGP